MTNKKISASENTKRLPNPNQFFAEVLKGLEESKSRQNEIREENKLHERKYDKPNLRKLDI